VIEVGATPRGAEGEHITANPKTIADIPLKLKGKG
jgi:NAD-dependent DNA ligase